MANDYVSRVYNGNQSERGAELHRRTSRLFGEFIDRWTP